MPNISITIRCGTHICSKSPGEACTFAGMMWSQSRKASVPICRLFPSGANASFTELAEKDGFALRCETCLSAEMDDPTVALRKRLHDLEIDLISKSDPES